MTTEDGPKRGQELVRSAVIPPRRSTPPEPPPVSSGRGPSASTPPADHGPYWCDKCGHDHAGPRLGGICVGCPCDRVVLEPPSPPTDEQAQTCERCAELEAKLAALRKHTLDSNPALRTLHANATAYLDAVAALQDARGGGPLSTTLAWLIRQGHLIPAEERVS